MIYQFSSLLNDKKLSEYIDGASLLGNTFDGYVLKIVGGHDEDGFAMKQGVLVNKRVRLLMTPAHSGLRKVCRRGARYRKTVRGCIIGPDIRTLNVIIVKKGNKEIPKLTDSVKPNRLMRKRATRLRRQLNLTKKDDLRPYINQIRRAIKDKDGKVIRTKAPKIQRMITPKRLHRKRHMKALKKRRYAKQQQLKQEYHKLLTSIRHEKRKALLSKRSSKRKTTKKTTTKKE